MNSVSCWCFVFKYYSCLDTCKLGQHCRRLRLQFIRYLLWQKMITGRIWISEWVIQWTYLHKPTWPRIWGYTLPHPHIYTNKEIKGWIKAKEKGRGIQIEIYEEKKKWTCNVMWWRRSAACKGISNPTSNHLSHEYHVSAQYNVNKRNVVVACVFATVNSILW